MGQSTVHRQTAGKRRAGVVVALALLATGCASNAEYFAAIDRANEQAAMVESARFEALARLAETGDDATRMAAAMALALSTGSASSIAVPERPQNQALQWASILVPSVTQLGIAGIGATVQRSQITANRDVAINTNRSFVDLGRAGLDGVATVGAAGADATARTAQSGLATIEAIAGGDDD